MPPLRTSMSSVKPMKTERTHEENQERAYIAASRRSDRSLEARVESARRASEIHKRRTGRSLRVTEQDVVNEEMYEEEDDDLPMQYRRLTAHLQTQNADFNRRVQAYLVNQVAMRQAVGNAAADTMYMNNQQFSPQGQYMNPGFMQMPGQQQQPHFQGSMMPPQMYNRTPSTYRQQPYPMPQGNMQSMRPNYHSRSVSIATPQEATHYQQQHSVSAQTSPVEAKAIEERRMSMPLQTAMPHTPMSQGQAHSPTHVSPTISRNGSSGNLAAQQVQSPQQVPTPPEHKKQRPQPSRQLSFSSPFDAGFEQMMQGGFNPLTTQLPMESQQMLADVSPTDMNFTHNMMSQPARYSYNPNGKPKGDSHSSGTNGFQHGTDGLNQTLMAPQLDTSFNGFDKNTYMLSPQSNDPMLNTPQTPMGYGGFGMHLAMPGAPMGMNDGYDHDLKTGNSTVASGHVTPQDVEWGNFMEYGQYSSQEDLQAT